MKAITYLIYIIFWEGLTIGGCSYIVFFKGENPYWFILAILLSISCFKPASWNLLFNKFNEEEKK